MFAVARGEKGKHIYIRRGERWHLCTNTGWEAAGRIFQDPTRFNYFASALELLDCHAYFRNFPMRSFCQHL